MIGSNTNIGIGNIGGMYPSAGGGNGGGNARLPEQFVITNGPTRQVVLSSAARGVSVTHNRKPQIQTTQEAQNKDYTHVANSTNIDFSFDLVNGDVVTVLPID